MLEDKFLDIIKKEMESGNPIKVAAKKHNIEIGSVKSVRRQLVEKFGKATIAKIIKEKILPSNPEMIRSVGGALGKGLKNFAGGGRFLATKEKIKERESICKGCDFYEDNKCMKCGCVMSNKIKLQVSHCPLDKW